MKLKHLGLLFLSILAAGSILSAQPRDSDIKFRLAQSYERAGDWENAVKLYEELYANDSTNVVIFESLRRGYLQLKRYNDAVLLIQAQIRFRPNDVSLLSQLGVVHARAGDEKQAFAVWDRALNIDRRNANHYRIVAGAALESRLFDRAIVTYQRARSEIGDATLFAADLGHLYAITMNFGEATKEYITLIRQNPSQLPFAQARIATFTGRPEGLAAALQAVTSALRTEPNNIVLHQLLGWLYMEGKEFHKAFSTYLKIDRLANAGGRELYLFAERALRERAYEAASNAFKAIVDNYPNFDRMPLVKFGMARTLEESIAYDDQPTLFISSDFLVRGPWSASSHASAKSVAETQSRFIAAINMYNDIIREYPRGEVAASSLQRISIIQFERLFDLHGAISTCRRLIEEYPGVVHLVVDAQLRLGDALLTKGDLDEAVAQYRAVADRRLARQDARDLARYRIAEVEFFRGRFEGARELLAELSKNPASDVTNDALTLRIFIGENSNPDSTALLDFAKASMYVRQRKLPDAVTLLETIEKEHPKSNLIDETLMLLGDVYTQMERYDRGVAAYERLINEFPESIVLDRAHMKLGWVYEFKLANRQKAIATYQALLEKYPNSIYTTEARKRIREMRGDNI